MINYIQKATRFYSVSPVSDIQGHRIKVALLAGTSSISIVGLLWTVIMFSYGLLNLAFVESLVIVLALFTYAAVRKGFIRFATLMFLAGIYLILVWMCLFLDPHSKDLARSIQIYFIPLAFYAYVLLKNEEKILQFLSILTSLITFIFFTGSSFSVVSEYNVPLHVREFASWLNSSIAVALVSAILYIANSDFKLRSVLGKELSLALIEKQFELFYQPQIDEFGHIYGAEALIRWNHPSRGLLPPSEFIFFAEQEQVGLIDQIGHWVLDAACQQLTLWASKVETSHLVLSVNVSALQFRDVQFVPKLLKMIDVYKIDVSKLKLELTESIMVEKTDEVTDKINQLSKLGIGVSLDDFGTGFSSLSYLNNMKIDQLKIDKAFVDPIKNGADGAIARNILALGRDLKLKVVAEGIETLEQKTFLLKNGCKAFQGYFFSKPLPVNMFDQFIAHPLC
jgi:EAL domain-containing protein (putative c-di-GMP-specific phosphodiesterase class I)